MRLRRVVLVILAYVIVLLFLHDAIDPGNAFINRLTPFVSGMPFLWFFAFTYTVLIALAVAALYVDEVRGGRSE